VAVQEETPAEFHNRLGICMAMQAYQAQCELLASERWRRLAEAGAQPQRLLWASTGTKDAAAPDTLYVEALGASGTIITLPEKILLAFHEHGHLGTVLPADGGHADVVLQAFRREGVDDAALANKLQRQGVDAFALSWHAMLTLIKEKCLASRSTAK
jgi:transaldolase